MDDWEVEEVLYSSRSLRKQSDCFLKHAKGAKKVTISFEILQNGRVRKVSTTAKGALNDCLKPIFKGMRWREFGGQIKKVKYPLEFG